MGCLCHFLALSPFFTMPRVKRDVNSRAASGLAAILSGSGFRIPPRGAMLTDGQRQLMYRSSTGSRAIYL